MEIYGSPFTYPYTDGRQKCSKQLYLSEVFGQMKESYYLLQLKQVLYLHDSNQSAG